MNKFSRDKIEFVGVIYHDSTSKGEGHPLAGMKVIFPPYLTYDENFMTNYTLDYVLTTAFAPHGFDILFNEGLLYPDIVSFNFSLTIDPDELLKPGSGIQIGSVATTVLCNQAVFQAWPPGTTAEVPCGDWTRTPVIVSGPGNFIVHHTNNTELLCFSWS